MSSDSVLKYYISVCMREFDVVSSSSFILPPKIEAWIVHAHERSSQADVYALIAPETPLGDGLVVQVWGTRDDAARVFEGLSFQNKLVNSRNRPDGLVFRCTDGAWSWASDYTAGIILKHGEISRPLVAFFGKNEDIRASLSRNWDLQKGTVVVEPVIKRREKLQFSGHWYEESTLFRVCNILLMDGRSNGMTLWVKMHESPRLTPDGRLDEPAIEALLSTYLSFEPPSGGR